MRRLDLVLFIVPSSSRLAALPAVLQSAILFLGHHSNPGARPTVQGGEMLTAR